MKNFLIYRFNSLNGGWLLTLVVLLGLTNILSAEGILQVAPTAADAPVMLETGRPDFGSFADYDGPETGRLYVSIGRADEKVYFGLAPEYQDNGTPFTRFSFSQYRFRVRRATESGVDPIVHGPFVIGNDNANVNSYGEAAFGVYDTTATQFGRSIYVFEPGEVGDYYIEFDEFANDGNRKVNIPFWDITVTRDGLPVIGRVWSKNWAFRTPEILGTNPPDCVWDRPFNGVLYSYTEDGFVSRIDFEGAGMQGLSFNVAFNRKGPGNTGDLGADRMSVPGENAILNSAEHRVFLSLPDIELFPDGVCGEVAAAETFVCDGSAPYCLEVSVTRPGQVEVLLDFNGNGILDDTIDVSLVYEFTDSIMATCIPWDGLRGDSSEVTFSDTVDVIITYAQGVQHWSAYDVEFMKNGFCVETVRPVCSQTQSSEFLYWDDRNIPGESGTGAPKDQRTGCSCLDGCRTWNNFTLNSDQCDNFDDEQTGGYGDKNTLNTWWFANTQSSFTARVPVVSAVILGPDIICQGDTAQFRAEDATVMGAISYSWFGPGVDGATTQEVEATTTGTYCVTIMDENGCSSTTCTDLAVIEVEADQFPESLSICFGESTSMVSPGNPEYEYLWSPSEGIDDVTSNQPTFFPSSTITYTVMVTRTNEFGQSCTIEEEITIEVSEDIGLTVLGGGGICDPTTTIEVLTDVEAEVTLFGPGNVVVGTGLNYTLPVSGSTNYVLIATDQQGCMDTVTFNLEGGPTEISVPDTVLSCLSDGVILSATNLDANDTLSYSWSPANLFVPETVNSANPVFNGPAGDYEVSVTATNQYGCATTETSRLIVIDDNASLSFTSEVDCNGSLLTFTNTSTAGFGLIYDFGDGTTSMDENPSHTYDVPGTYTVTLDLIYDQDCIESFSQQVTTVETVVEADFSFSLGDCLEPGATIEFVDNSTNNSGDPLSYSWSFTGATPSTSTDGNPSVTVPASGMVTASLTVTTVDDCSSTKDTTFTVNLALGNLSEEIIICPGDSAALNPDGDPALTYNWAPSPDFNADEVNPTTAVPGTYLVTITDPNAELSCVTVDTVTVIQPDDIGLEINGPNGPLVGGGIIDLPTLTFCGVADDISVDISTTDDVQVTFTDLGGNILGTGTTLTVNPAINDTIVVTATNMFGCFERDTVVLLNQAVMVEVDAEGGQIILCEPGDTSVTINNLNADDVLTYAWTANPIITSVLNQATVNVTTTTAGVETLSVLVTNQFGCDTTIQVEVITLEEIVLEIRGPNGVLTDGGLELPTLAFCGEPAELSVEIISGSNVDVSYLDLNGNVLGVGPSITLNPMGSDTIIVVADGELGCGTRDTIVIDNQSISVEVDAEGGQIILCEPGDTSVTVSNLNPEDVLTYAWTANPIITGALDAATVNITTTTAGVETLSVLVTNQFGCDTTIQVEVITLEEIVLEISGPNGVLTDGGLELPTLAFCGEPAELSVETVSGSNVDVFYTDLNGNVLGTGSSITLNPMGSDTIIVVADGELGCGTRDTIVINNEAVSVEIDAQGGRVILCEPGDTSVTINNLIADDVLTYVWEPNAIITGALDEATVDITTTAPGTETLSVLVTNQFGCDTTIQVDVITLEGIVLEITGPNGPLPDGGLELPTLSFCGEPAEITVDIMAGGAVDITYTDLDGNVLGMGTTLILNPSGRDTIVIIAGGELDCGLSDTIVVENNPISVDIDIEGDEIILCEPGDTSVTIDNLNAGDTLTYVWTDNPIITGPLNGPSVDITTTEPGSEVLSVLVTNQFGCDTTVNVTVTTLEPIGLVVNGPDGPITGDSLTTCGEPVDLTAELRVGDGITVTFTDPSGNVLGMGSSLTVDPELQDTVIITAENEFGCTEMDTVIIINQQVNAELTVEGMDLSLCESSDTLVGVVNLDPRDELTYQWAENDIINGPLDGPTVSITTPEEGSTELSVLVTNQFGCDTTLTLTVATIPFMPNQYTSPYQACFGDLVTIEGGPRVEGYVYEWSPADGLDLSDPANPMGVFTEDVTLTVVITDPVTGCSLEQVIEVMVTPEISLMASPADTTLCAPGSVDVTASSVNEAVIYTWYSDEALTDSIASGPDFTIEGGVPGETYVVYVRGVDPNTNCEQSIPVTVRVSELTAGFPDEVVAACAGEPTSIFTENSPIATLQYTYEPAGIIDDSDPANPTFTGDDSTVVTVTVTDPVTGCSETLQVTINVTNLLTLTGVANPPEIFTGQSSELSIEGCENCTYVWFPPTGTVEPDTGRVVTATPDEAGEWIYEVEVTSNGCTEIVEVLLIVEDPICDTDRIFIPNAFTPNGDNRNDVLRVRSKFAEEITEFTFIIYNRWGQEVYKSDDIFDGWDGTAGGDDLEPDVYGYWLRVRCPFGEELIQQGNVTLMR